MPKRVKIPLCPSISTIVILTPLREPQKTPVGFSEVKIIITIQKIAVNVKTQKSIFMIFMGDFHGDRHLLGVSEGQTTFLERFL
jgi:hypothetical protein